MFTSSILLTITSIASVALAEYRPDERVVLADCGIHPPNGESTSRQIMYYHAGPWDAQGTRGKWVTPDMMIDVPWDGSYPWRKNGVKRKMPNGDEFNIVIDPSIPDSNMRLAGLATHTMENHAFGCRAHHERGIYILDDGTECASAYICDHKSETRPGGGGGDAPAPAPGKTTSSLTLSSDAIYVTDSSLHKENLKLTDPNSVFNTVFDSIEGNGCRKTEYSISDSCKISYDCMFAGGDNDVKTRSAAVAKFLHVSAGPQVKKSWYESTTYEGQWGIPKYHIGYKYPRNGQIVITHDSAIQSQLSFEIKCGGSWFCDKGCTEFTTGMIALGYAGGAAPVGVFGTLTAGACGLFC
ncbi:hypothetical protein N7495_004260 [Penicillium taxi]|uniref:uncharacterized protein n=1 Tax=Penicillium taxi TaxID=168475 RepID=UPI002544F599|nr:uncharacterized protein N7495_004260 [Penicillium taxi]KAJ5899516.1 hypothetical protein N7495_004260 [Penicillium taxi]